MKLGPNALAVLQRRYLARDGAGNPTETAEQLFRRVARAVAGADLIFDPSADAGATESRFFELMTELDFLPNSPTLMNAGRELGQLSACFVLPVDDSMEAIFEAVKQAALIHKSGGGTGFSFSRLRPGGSTVRSTGGVASGPVSFLRVFNMATEAVKQGGTRRGANMGVLRVDHPDILAFIDCKQQNTDIQNFNISVGLTEAFLHAVEAGGEYDLIDPQTGSPCGALPAQEVFSRIVDGAWQNGEPGILFLDRLNRDNPVPQLGDIESTNPCGEQPLLPYESCNLGSVNLLNMLRDAPSGPELDRARLERTVRDAVHFLDNVIEINRFPLERIEQATKLTRKIGLGVMGFADLLLRLGVPYDSDEGVALGGELMRLVQGFAHAASAELAARRGPFPAFAESVYRDGPPLRNATLTTIAPTGTLSILAGVSSGVEPVFAYAYIRNIMDDTELLESSPLLRAGLESRGLYSDALMRRIVEQGSLAAIDELPQDLRRVFVCAHDVSPEYHVRMQAAFQQHTDNAVSKTVNLRHDATREQVAQVYRLAFQLGCKGITIYRDGSRTGQTLNIGRVDRGEAAPGGTALRPRPRPESVRGVTKRVKIGCGNLYVTVNYDETGIIEVFTSTGKAGGCPSQSEATARLASLALRSGIDVDSVIRQLRGIRCPSTIRRPGLGCSSCPDAIARVIREVDDALQNGDLAASPRTRNFKYCPLCGQPLREDAHTRRCSACDFTQAAPAPSTRPPEPAPQPTPCPECSEPLEQQGGCATCRNCGYSKCQA